MAPLPYQKTLDQFNFAFQSSIEERQIRELATLRFVHELSNDIFLVPPGWSGHIFVLASPTLQSAPDFPRTLPRPMNWSPI